MIACISSVVDAIRGLGQIVHGTLYPNFLVGGALVGQRLGKEAESFNGIMHAFQILPRHGGGDESVLFVHFQQNALGSVGHGDFRLGRVIMPSLGKQRGSAKSDGGKRGKRDGEKSGCFHGVFFLGYSGRFMRR